MRARHQILLATVIVLAAVSASPIATPIRMLAGIPLALVLPGHAMLAAFDPGRRVRDIERLVLGLALSVAIVIGVVVPLGAAGHIDRVPVAGGLAGVALAGYVVAGQRGWSPEWPREAMGRPRVRTVAPWLAVTVVLAAAALIGSRPFPAPVPVGYTTLSLLPAGPARAVSVVVNNREGRRTTYVVKVRVAGGRRTTSRAFVVSIEPNETLRRRIPLRGAGPRRVRVGLFRAAKLDEAYRRVSLFVPGPRGLPEPAGRP